MYYSALVYRNDEASRKVLELAKGCDIELKAFFIGDEQADFIVEALQDVGVTGYPLPCVLAGLDVIASGDYAWLDFYVHTLDNPHVHWEADEGEDAI